MKKRAFILLFVLVVMCSFLACSSDQVYGKEDTNISVDAGKTFTIQLDENITTGFQWSYVISDERIVSLDKDDYKEDVSSKNVAGAGGTRILKFKAISKGKADITLAYEQSFKENSAVENLNYHIEVN